MPTRVKGRQGEELSAYLPLGKIAEVDEVRGPYFTRSKFVLWALDRAIEEVRSGTLRIEKIPRGAEVGSQAPSGRDSSFTNTTPNTPKEFNPKEDLVGAS